MILGADILRSIFSVQALVVLLVVSALWMAATASRAARRFLYVLAIFYVLATIDVVPTALGKAWTRGLHPFKPSDVAGKSRVAIVVLGSGSVTVGDWWGDNYSVVDHVAAERVLEASHVYKAIQPAYVISSGGDPHPNRHQAPSGDTMKTALVQLGVPADRILVETRSATTRDEAVIVKEMLRQLPVDRLVLVTSQSHMPRALGTFRAVGLDCVPAMAAEFDFGNQLIPQILPTSEGLEATSEIVHEVGGLVYYWARGWWVR